MVNFRYRAVPYKTRSSRGVFEGCGCRGRCGWNFFMNTNGFGTEIDLQANICKMFLENPGILKQEMTLG